MKNSHFTTKDTKGTKLVFIKIPILRVLRDLGREKRSRSSLIAYSLAAALLSAPALSFAQVEDVLAKLNALHGEQREKVLVENARKEGTVTFYAATNLSDTQQVI